MLIHSDLADNKTKSYCAQAISRSHFCALTVKIRVSGNILPRHDDGGWG